MASLLHASSSHHQDAAAHHVAHLTPRERWSMSKYSENESAPPTLSVHDFLNDALQGEGTAESKASKSIAVVVASGVAAGSSRLSSKSSTSSDESRLPATPDDGRTRN